MKLSTEQCKFLIYLYHKGSDKMDSNDVQFPLDSEELFGLKCGGYLEYKMRNVNYMFGKFPKVHQVVTDIDILFKGMWVCYLMKKDLYEH